MMRKQKRAYVSHDQGTNCCFGELVMVTAYPVGAIEARVPTA